MNPRIFAWMMFSSLILSLTMGFSVNLFVGNEGNALIEQILHYTEICGKLFIQIIKMLIIPLVFFGLLTAISGVRSRGELHKIGKKMFSYYPISIFLALNVGLVVATLFFDQQEQVIQLTAAELAKIHVEKLSMTQNSMILPDNPLQAFVSGNMLYIVVFTMLLGFSVVKIGKEGKIIYRWSKAMNKTIIELGNMFMKWAPIGLFCIVFPVIATQGGSIAIHLLTYASGVILAFLIHLVAIQMSILKLVGNWNPIHFLKQGKEAYLMAFFTASSATTLSTTESVAVNKLGLKKNIAQFVLPFGGLLNLEGVAIMQATATVFLMKIYGLDLSYLECMMIAGLATLSAMGASGVRGTGTMMLALVFQSAGIPISGIFLVMGINVLLDMPRTALNVFGDMTCCAVVDSLEKRHEAADPRVL